MLFAVVNSLLMSLGEKMGWRMANFECFRFIVIVTAIVIIIFEIGFIISVKIIHAVFKTIQLFLYLKLILYLYFNDLSILLV